MGQVSLKPSKPLSVGMLIALIFMLLFGVAFAVLVGEEIYGYGDEPALKVLFSLFMAVWIGGVLFMIIYHFLNIKRTKGLSFIEIEEDSGSSMETAMKDPIQRLRDLEALKRDKLISASEYEMKRKEIMNEKW